MRVTVDPQAFDWAREPVGSSLLPTSPAGSGLPTPSRRTLATALQASTRSEASALRHPASARRLRRLEGMGSPSLGITIVFPVAPCLRHGESASAPVDRLGVPVGQPALSVSETPTYHMRCFRRLTAAGADRIDVGCDPGGTWAGVGDAVRMLVAEGFAVSIDSFDTREIASAVRAGASLVLSVNSTNVAAAADWGCEVVAVPDVPATLAGFDDTVAQLAAAGVRHRLDPVLEPIGFGFAASLGRYLDVRGRHPAAEMMMGIGNLTELTDVDSAGVNTLLLGFCQEVGIRSVLTTEVIHWARSSVKECALARALVHHAVANRTLPKHVEPRLVTLRSGKPQEHGPEALAALANAIRDPNIRIFAERGVVHVVGAGLHLESRDPFSLFAELEAARPDIDPSHAFYLGYEMAKAVTALTLSKDYRQDQALDWGHLTQPEIGHGPSRAAADVARKAGAPGPLADAHADEVVRP